MSDKETVIAEEILNLTEIADGGEVVSITAGENQSVLVLVSKDVAE